MFVVGPATLQNISGVLEDGAALVRDGVTALDLSEVTELDSSLLAAALAWLRQAKESGHTLELAHVPDSLLTLAGLYGVGDLLGLGAAPGH